MDATVSWEQSTLTAIGIKNNIETRLQIDNNVATVNGKKVTLDVAATVIDGSTLVPARFIAESLGADVEWDPHNRNVYINFD